MAYDGHPGNVRVKQRCKEAVLLPNMNSHIEQLVLECEARALSEKSGRPVQAPTATNQVAYPSMETTSG